jgi:hypothetical protein
MFVGIRCQPDTNDNHDNKRNNNNKNNNNHDYYYNYINNNTTTAETTTPTTTTLSGDTPGNVQVPDEIEAEWSATLELQDEAAQPSSSHVAAVNRSSSSSGQPAAAAAPVIALPTRAFKDHKGYVSRYVNGKLKELGNLS